jgi:basic membrane protein A
MKRFYLLFVLLLVSLVVVACQEEEPVDETVDPTNFKIAMITDVGDIDDKSFNQGTWEGIVAYATANNKVHEYFRPGAVSDNDYVETIELAISQGFQIIVTPGFLFETAIHAVQSEHPDVFFILIDGAPHSGNYAPDIAPNTLSIFFNEHESGWLAGYAAVKDGFDQLGFMGGMAVPAVVRFGVGYVAGAYYAAYEMGLETFSFPAVNYEYLGGFGPSDEHKTKATAMYNRGVQVIHAAAGGAGNSVMAAAEEIADKWVIGVDIDQRLQSTRVMSSALKGLGVAVQNGLADIYGGTFQGGRSIFLGAAQDAVGLPPQFDRFTTFDAATYNIVFAKLAAGVLGAPSSPAQLGAYIAALGYTVPAGLVAKAQ